MKVKIIRFIGITAIWLAVATVICTIMAIIGMINMNNLAEGGMNIYEFIEWAEMYQITDVYKTLSIVGTISTIALALIRSLLLKEELN